MLFRSLRTELFILQENNIFWNKVYGKHVILFWKKITTFECIGPWIDTEETQLWDWYALAIVFWPIYQFGHPKNDWVSLLNITCTGRKYLGKIWLNFETQQLARIQTFAHVLKQITIEKAWSLSWYLSLKTDRRLEILTDILLSQFGTAIGLETRSLHFLYVVMMLWCFFGDWLGDPTPGSLCF